MVRAIASPFDRRRPISIAGRVTSPVLLAVTASLGKGVSAYPSRTDPKERVEPRRGAPAELLDMRISVQTMVELAKTFGTARMNG
jgi:hypothetical protein